jgi:hypothetical protein
MIYIFQRKNNNFRMVLNYIYFTQGIGPSFILQDKNLTNIYFELLHLLELLENHRTNCVLYGKLTVTSFFFFFFFFFYGDESSVLLGDE